jgi:hypothetical protein
MIDLTQLLVGGVPLLIVIFGLVEFSKSMGLKGRPLTVLSLVLGIIFGLAYQFSIQIPVGFAAWFAVVVFGLALGLVTSGFYDFANDRFPKIQKPPF